MNALQLHTALRDHIARNRRINAAREQHRSPSARPGRQSARTGHRRPMHIRRCLTYLNVHHITRIVHIDRHLRKFLGNSAADVLRDLDGIQREPLVRPLRFHLEALLHRQLVSEILHNRLEDRVQILLARAAAAHLRDAEDRAAGFPRAVEVAVVVFRLNIERRLRDRHLEVAEHGHSPARVGFQLVLKCSAVLSFQDDLAQFQQK